MRFTPWDYLLFPGAVTFLVLVILFLITKRIMVRQVKKTHHPDPSNSIGLLFLFLSIGIMLLSLWIVSPVLDVLSILETGSREAGGQVVAAETVPGLYRTFASGQFCGLTDITLDNGHTYTILTPAAPEEGDWVRLEYVPDSATVLECNKVSAQEAAAVVAAPVPTKEERNEALNQWMAPTEQCLAEAACAVLPALLLYALWAAYIKPHREKEFSVPGRWERAVMPRRYGLPLWWPAAIPPVLSLGITFLRGRPDHLWISAVLCIPLLLCLFFCLSHRAEFSTSQIHLYFLGRRRTYAISQVHGLKWVVGNQWGPDRLELTFEDGKRAVFPVLAYTGVGSLYKMLVEHPYLNGYNQ